MSEAQHAGARRLNVSLVAADRKVWQGTAEMVIARTTEGDTGVLPGHQPILSILLPSVVSVRGAQSGTGGAQALEAVVSGGFLSVARDGVSVLAESVLLPSEIDVAAAQQLAADARAAEDAAGDDQEAREQAEADLRFAEAQLRVAGHSSVGTGH
ncbi:MAG: ATP synthase F1 subunit epsilon [Catenulispora sp. 13_1_20CM_3_70_7]|jgi:F-type H+-transporting ATPase subunit epsilon|nr:F0F1 ATP synthase subunit epsilon [Catenulisporales bacterium]OLE24670.1 MAG: ATP synthase F1 subunit epsilon [Catenulispora sp. 13_1_20CM_3_70_7]